MENSEAGPHRTIKVQRSMRNCGGPRRPRSWPKQHERQITGKRGPLWASKNRPKIKGPRNPSSRPQGSHSQQLEKPTEHRGNLKTALALRHSTKLFYYHRGRVRTRFMQSAARKYILGCHVLLPMRRRGMPQAPNFTRRNDRVGNLHHGVKLGKGILATKCWGVRQGERQRIGRMKYLFTNYLPITVQTLNLCIPAEQASLGTPPEWEAQRMDG